jgi:hypothetical protein
VGAGKKRPSVHFTAKATNFTLDFHPINPLKSEREFA